MLIELRFESNLIQLRDGVYRINKYFGRKQTSHDATSAESSKARATPASKYCSNVTPPKSRSNRASPKPRSMLSLKSQSFSSSSSPKFPKKLGTDYDNFTYFLDRSNETGNDVAHMCCRLQSHQTNSSSSEKVSSECRRSHLNECHSSRGVKIVVRAMVFENVNNPAYSSIYE